MALSARNPHITIYDVTTWSWVNPVNFERGTRDANFGFDEERVARLSPERVWLHKTIGKMERFSVESCVGSYHVYELRWYSLT